MLVPRSVALFSWQLAHVRLDTAAWATTDSTGVLVILNPPVTKLDAWQLLQTAVDMGM